MITFKGAISKGSLRPVGVTLERVSKKLFRPVDDDLRRAAIDLNWNLARAVVGHKVTILGKKVFDRGVVRRTPISPLPDRSGTTAGAWRASQGRRISQKTRAAKQRQRPRLSITRPRRLTPITIANPTAAAVALETGTYPSPVKRGTYVPGVGFVVRSAGGFSKRAKEGIVRPTIHSIKSQAGGR